LFIGSKFSWQERRQSPNICILQVYRRVILMPKQDTIRFTRGKSHGGKWQGKVCPHIIERVNDDIWRP
jgi:hypothetical protein